MSIENHEIRSSEEAVNREVTDKSPQAIIPEGSVTAEVVLSPEKYGASLPLGRAGEVRTGYSFFELVQEEDGNIKREFLASRMGEKPILEAVIEPNEWQRIQKIKKDEEREAAINKTQYGRWKGKKIVARPVEFIWQEDKGLWTVKGTNGFEEQK